MARILITGSSDGLGLLAARWLAGRDHQVVLHARNEQRARVALDFNKKETPCHPGADDPALQDGLLAACEALTGVRFPRGEYRAS